jgi:hypothetical protein
MDKFCTVNVTSATPTKIVDAANFGNNTVMQVIVRLCNNAVIASLLVTKNTNTGELSIYDQGSPVNCTIVNSSGSLYFSQTTGQAINIDVYCRHKEF